jgi:pyrimidine-specific ribonucleoside hydrolase
MVIDTDAGLDDAIAILYLASSPAVDLRAVTVTGTGLAHCFPGARNVVGLLELAGRSDVPVSCGPEEPLGPDDLFQPFPEDWRRMADGRYGDAWRIGRGEVDERPAPELLIESVRRAARPVTLVTLGPLTNVSAALAKDEGVASRIEQVVAMGGAFDVSGNTSNAEPPPTRDVAEWNIYADPQSARHVVDSDLALRFVPLDATNAVPLDAAVMRAVARAPTTDVMSVVSGLLSGVHGMVTAGEYYLWDPLAAVLAVRPELGTLEDRAVDVVTEGADAGRTVTAGRAGQSAEIFTAVDGRAAEAELLSGLTGSQVATVDDRPDVLIDARDCTLSDGEAAQGSLLVQVVPEVPRPGATGVAIGTLDPGRGEADIRGFFAEPTVEPPAWFTMTATLGALVGGSSTDVVRFEPGEYTVVCVRGAADDLELVGIGTLTVR